MTTARTKAPPASSATDAAETPWYELINEVPEPPEDGLVEDAVITLIKAILIARYANDPATLVLGPATFLIYDSDTPGSLIAPDCYVMVRRGRGLHLALPAELSHRRMGRHPRIRA